MLYAASAFWSAYAETYVMLYLARMLGWCRFWGSVDHCTQLTLPKFQRRQIEVKLVSIQQLNIVIGFFAAFLCNWYLNLSLSRREWTGLRKRMYGVGCWASRLSLPCSISSFCCWFPLAHAGCFTRGRTAEGHAILQQLHGQEEGDAEAKAIKDSIEAQAGVVQSEATVELFNPKLGFRLTGRSCHWHPAAEYWYQCRFLLRC